MNRKKRSTVFGAALLILGSIFIIMALGKADSEKLRWLRWPQGGLSKPGDGAPTGQATVPVGPVFVDKINFTDEDTKRVSLRYGDGCNYRPDVKTLLQKQLQWDLSGGEPTVLIVHTHGSESYSKQAGQNYTETTAYRTLDTDYNMVALGEKLAQLLQQAGITVIHDRTLHDYPSYNDAYANSRRAVQDYLGRYPTIQVVLDLHRDAALNADGSQYAPTVTADGQTIAQLMLVVGTNASGMHHPNWETNLASAAKLQVLLERQVPGLTRPTILRAQRYNHDLSSGAMIVEIGTAGNTLRQAMGAVPYLAEALIQLCHGTTADSTN